MEMNPRGLSNLNSPLPERCRISRNRVGLLPRTCLACLVFDCVALVENYGNVFYFIYSILHIEFQYAASLLLGHGRDAECRHDSFLII